MRGPSTSVLMWFRRDLRVEANPALEAAAALAEELRGNVVPLFVLDPELIRSGRANRMAFLFEALRSLRASGVPLVVRFGRSEDVVVAMSEEFRSAAVVCAGDFSPLGRARDARVGRRLRAVNFGGLPWTPATARVPWTGARATGRDGAARRHPSR